MHCIARGRDYNAVKTTLVYLYLQSIVACNNDSFLKLGVCIDTSVQWRQARSVCAAKKYLRY